MKSSTVLLAAALLLPAVAMAAPVTVNFTAQVNTSAGGTLPAAGTTFTGAYVFDDDTTAYTLWPTPGDPHSLGYETFSASYGLVLQWPSGPLDFTQGGGIAIQVTDGGAPGDAVFFGVKRNNVSYNTALFGPDTSFAGNSLPTSDWLSSGWTSGSFTVRNNDTRQTVLTATLTGISVSSVPELSTWLMMGLGLGAVALGARRSTRRRGLEPAAA